MNTYYAKPIHLVYPVLLFAAGVKCFFMPGEMWPWIGMGLWLACLVAAVWIVIAGFWAERSRYYDSIAGVIEAAGKTNLETLAALGFSADEIPQKIRVDIYAGTSTRHFDLPISAAKLKPFAAGLLAGQPFAERRWVNDAGLFSADEFRRLRGVMRDRELIEPVNDKDNRQGFKLSQTGIEFMQACLSSPPPSAEMAE